jgi:hypothetical protein
LKKDFGAHHGLIISKNNFQSGAREATKNTNIKLLTWYEFLNLFEKRWIEETIGKMDRISRPLRDFDGVIDISKLSPTQFQIYRTLCTKYLGVAVYGNRIWYENCNLETYDKDDLDKVLKKIINDCFPAEGINFYNDFFHLLMEKCIDGIDEFSNFVKSIDQFINPSTNSV